MKTYAALLLAVVMFVPTGALAIPHAIAPVNAQTRNELIQEGTFIRIRMLTQLSSAYSKAGDQFSWVVSDDVVVGGRVVIPAGNIGFGKVLQSSPAHGGGTPGFLRLHFNPIALTDGSRVEVAVTRASAILDQNAKNGYAPAVDEVASVAIPYFFLFDVLRKGDDMTIRQNAVFHVAVTEDAYATNGAVAISATPPPRPTPTPSAAASAAPPGTSAAPASASASAAPAGASAAPASASASPASTSAAPPAPTPAASVNPVTPPQPSPASPSQPSPKP